MSPEMQLLYGLNRSSLQMGLDTIRRMEGRSFLTCLPGVPRRRPLRWLYLSVATLGVCVYANAETTVTSQRWGQVDGTTVTLFTLTRGRSELKVTNYGARIVSIRVPNRSGVAGNVVEGPDDVDGFTTPLGAAMGATIGRYANRIARGQFSLNGAIYQIPTNPDGNALHGGPAGFNHKVWSARQTKDGVEMTLVSPDAEMGFPGKLAVHVRFTLTTLRRNPAVVIHYTAETNKTTVVNLTNHTFFNLADDRTLPVQGDLAKIEADTYTPFDSAKVPTGVIAWVAKSAFDFRDFHPIGSNIPTRGYDNNLVLRPHRLTHSVAEVDDPTSGRTITVFTTEPALQLFVPLPGISRDGVAKPSLPPSFCLETQHFPDSPNRPQFPSTVLRPNTTYRSTTIYVFGVKTAGARSYTPAQ